jgi:hypothetical protein
MYEGKRPGWHAQHDRSIAILAHNVVLADTNASAQACFTTKNGS